jgi:adenylate cyclase
VSAVIELVLETAAREHETVERKHLAAAEERASRLLSASPAVMYSFKAKGDFAATFVSDNITRLFGYGPREYLDNPNFWRVLVHPEDLPRIEAEVTGLFQEGKHALGYRFRRKDGSYCWVNDEQHLVRDEKGEPAEIVGSWSDISARKTAEGQRCRRSP